MTKKSNFRKQHTESNPWDGLIIMSPRNKLINNTELQRETKPVRICGLKLTERKSKYVFRKKYMGMTDLFLTTYALHANVFLTAV